MSTGWPSMTTYCDWARAQGCQLATAKTVCDERHFLRVVIRAPSGATVTEIVGEMDEPLMSTTIARLDRRLGLKSHLFR